MGSEPFERPQEKAGHEIEYDQKLEAKAVPRSGGGGVSQTQWNIELLKNAMVPPNHTQDGQSASWAGTGDRKSPRNETSKRPRGIEAETCISHNSSMDPSRPSLLFRGKSGVPGPEYSGPR